MCPISHSPSTRNTATLSIQIPKNIVLPPGNWDKSRRVKRVAVFPVIQNQPSLKSCLVTIEKHYDFVNLRGKKGDRNMSR